MTDPQSRPRIDLTDAAAVVLAGVQLVLAYAIWRHGPPGPIAVHFDFHGRPNGWADRRALAIGMAAVSAATLAIGGVVRLGAGGGARTMAITRAVLLAAAAMVTGILSALVFAPTAGLEPGGLIFSLSWLLFIVVGAAMGKTAPNPFVGVRVYWTMKSRLAWDKANRLMGRILFLGGLIGLLATPVVGLNNGLAILWLIIVAGGGGCLAVFESWRVWRVDPERIP